MSETTERRAQGMARLERDLRRMTVLQRRAVLQRAGRRRVLELRLRRSTADRVDAA